jgi:hypothetical protein
LNRFVQSHVHGIVCAKREDRENRSAGI